MGLCGRIVARSLDVGTVYWMDGMCVHLRGYLLESMVMCIDCSDYEWR